MYSWDKDILEFIEYYFFYKYLYSIKIRVFAKEYLTDVVPNQ